MRPASRQRPGRGRARRGENTSPPCVANGLATRTCLSARSAALDSRRRAASGSPGRPRRAPRPRAPSSIAVVRRGLRGAALPGLAVARRQSHAQPQSGGRPASLRTRRRLAETDDGDADRRLTRACEQSSAERHGGNQGGDSECGAARNSGSPGSSANETTNDNAPALHATAADVTCRSASRACENVPAARYARDAGGEQREAGRARVEARAIDERASRPVRPRRRSR